MNRLVARTLTTTLLLASPVMAQTAVPIHREPRHRPVYEGDGFRVLDVQIPSGDTTLYHVHDAAIIYTAVATSPTDFQPAGGAWNGTKPTDAPAWNRGEARIDTGYVAQPLTHRVTNVGKGLFRLIAVVSTRPGAKGDAPAAGGEVPGASELRSTWFRQTRLELPVQGATEWHTSSVPVVVVTPLGGDVEVQVGDATQRLSAAGSFATIGAGGRYRLRNVGAAAATAILVQVR